MKNICIGLFLLSLTASTIHAQWESLHGPYGCNSVFGFYAEDSTIYASTSIGIYQSSDQGHDWSLIPLSLPQNIFYLKLLYKRDKFFFIELETTDSSNDHFLYFSDDGGKTLMKLFDSSYAFCVSEIDSAFIIGRLMNYHCTNDLRTLLRSTDQGKTWNNITPNRLGNFRFMKKIGTSLYSICSRSDYNFEWQFARSGDGGMTWDSLFGFNTQDVNLLPDVTMFTPYFGGTGDTNVLIAFDSMPEFSVIRPQHFVKLSLRNDSVTAFTFLSGIPGDTVITDMFLYDKSLFALTRNQVYKYEPFPEHWIVLTDKIGRSATNDIISQFFPTSQNSNEFLLTFSNQSQVDSLGNLVFRCLPGSGILSISDSGITNTSVNQLLCYNDTLYIRTFAGGKAFFTSGDHGESCLATSLPFSNDGFDISAMGSPAKGFLYNVKDTLYLKGKEGNIQPVFLLGAGGARFLRMGTIYYFNSGSQFFRSDDSGSTWHKLSSIVLNHLGLASTVFGNLLLYGADSIVISSDSGKTWSISKGFPLYCTTLASNDGSIYAEGETLTGVTSYQLFRSSDSGVTWIPIGPERNAEFSTILTINNRLLLCSAAGVFSCNQDGSGFAHLFANQPIRGCHTMESDSEYLYVGTGWGYAEGIFRAKLSDVLNYVDAVSPQMHTEDISLRVYPNPSDGSFSISSTTALAIVSISDELGREVWKNERISNAASGIHAICIDGKNLPHGTLYVRATDEFGKIKTVKLIRH
jgi:photosystem II stability/assembly factor-like uncharacterized protein